MSSGISILVLAAGASTRMKAVKQLLRWEDKSLVEHVIDMACFSKADTVYVVLGAHRKPISEKLSGSNAIEIINDDWESGMGSSIAIGVKEILKCENPDGILLLLADQPLINTDYINRLIDTFRDHDKSIIGTAYPSKTGVPALFGRAYYPELMTLKGSEGAWAVISKYSECSMAIDAGEKIEDLDTREDYKRLS